MSSSSDFLTRVFVLLGEDAVKVEVVEVEEAEAEAEEEDEDVEEVVGSAAVIVMEAVVVAVVVAVVEAAVVNLSGSVGITSSSEILKKYSLALSIVIQSPSINLQLLTTRPIKYPASSYLN